MFNARIGADTAAELGMLNWVSPTEEFPTRTHELAQELARGPALALAYMKFNLVRATYESLEDNMYAEVPLHKATGLTDDHIAAVRAFVEKRRPVFG